VENKGFVYNLDNKSAAPAQISITGTPPDVRAALHYHASSRSYFTWDGTTSVFRLTPTISGSTYTALAWSTVAAAGSSVTLPPRNPNGMYNKVQLIKNMGNGQAALVIVPAYANPDVFVFKLPNIGV
jgi:hypothetical protein